MRYFWSDMLGGKPSYKEHHYASSDSSDEMIQWPVILTQLTQPRRFRSKIRNPQSKISNQLFLPYFERNFYEIK